MKILSSFLAGLALLAMTPACGRFNPEQVPDAAPGAVAHVEPLSWWTGMKLPLQLLINGPEISTYDIRIEGGSGVSVKAVNKAESPNYVFVDVNVAASAKPGTYWIVFSKDGQPGPICRKLYNKLRNIQYGIEPDVHGWTRVVIG